MKVSNLKALLVTSIVSFSIVPNSYATNASKEDSQKEIISILKENLNSIKKTNFTLNNALNINNQNNEKSEDQMNKLLENLKDNFDTLNKNLILISTKLDVIASNQNKNQQISISQKPHPINKVLESSANSN